MTLTVKSGELTLEPIIRYGNTIETVAVLHIADAGHKQSKAQEVRTGDIRPSHPERVYQYQRVIKGLLLGTLLLTPYRGLAPSTLRMT